jgi:hypothetical protein
VRRDLRGLQKDTAETVARHLVAAGRLVDEDPGLALEHARFARARASRIAVVREAAGIAAYHAGEWTEALGELRAARRMGGGPGHVAVMADIERALGRPERALELSRGPEVRELDRAEGIELAIVAAGARRDLGERDAAVVSLQIPELDPARRDPWSARLFYAYADNLLAAGREPDALQWFVHAADADEDGETDAALRIAELTGEELPEDDFDIGVEDIGVEEDQPPAPDAASAGPGDTGAPAAAPSASVDGGTEPGGGATSTADSDAAAADPGSGADEPAGGSEGERTTGTGSVPADPSSGGSAPGGPAAAAGEPPSGGSVPAGSAPGVTVSGEPGSVPAGTASGGPAPVVPGGAAPGGPAAAAGEPASAGSASAGSAAGVTASGEPGSAPAGPAPGGPALAPGETAPAGSAPGESARDESASVEAASAEGAPVEVGSEQPDAGEERGPGASG